MITWGVLSVAMMFVEAPTSFYVLRFLLGVAEAGFLPGIIYYLGNWYPAAERARAVSWFMLAIPLSTVVGGPLAGIILELDGWHGLTGWQWLFLLEGIPAVVLGFVVLGYLTDSPDKAEWLEPDERRWLTERVRAEQRAAQQRARRRPRRRARASDRVAARPDHVRVPNRQLRADAVDTADRASGLSGYSDFTVEHDLGAAVRRGGSRHDRDRRELGPHRRAVPAHRASRAQSAALGFIASAYFTSPLPGMIALDRRGRRRSRHARTVLGAADALPRRAAPRRRASRLINTIGVARRLRRPVRRRASCAT